MDTRENFRKVGALVENEDPKFYFEFYKEKYEEGYKENNQEEKQVEGEVKDTAEDKEEEQKSAHHLDRYAITFGEVAILHVGGAEFGKGIREHGFSVEELKALAKKIESAEYVSLSNNLPEEMRKANEAGVLVIRGVDSASGNQIPVSRSFADKLFHEQKTKVEYDSQFWDNRRSKTLNKRARKNVVFGEKEIEHSEDYK